MTDILTRIFVKDYKNLKDPTVRKRYGSFSSYVGICVNVILALVKLLIGVVSASMAIIADALNNFSDAGASIVTLVSFKLSSKPADRDHPFGHARIEYIASMIVSFLILLVGVEMFTDAISSILGLSDSSTPDFSVPALVILGLSIVFKLWLAVFYKKIATKIDSSVIKASSADSLYDCISTTAVLISSIIIKITNVPIIDSIVGMGVSVLIFVAGIRILIETKNSLLGEAPMEEIVDSLKSLISEYPEVLGIHDLMLHNYGPKVYIASLHVEVDGGKDVYLLHDIIDNIERRIQNEMNILCTIHMDPIITDDEVLNELKDFALKTIAEDVDESITLHDFRAVIGVTHTNLIFDIVLPYESKYTQAEIVDEVSSAINKKRNNCYCVITVDRG